jgi:hypothetical protein
LLDILKIVLPFLGGGLAGAVLNEWFRRRGSKLQSIPLIERVNRLVDPKLEGFTLARLGGDALSPRLEEVKNVREYQLTLRNTATVHLQDVEIQFEFPVEDIEGWASRPALSKTAPVLLESSATSPWKKSFRWRIPHLPSSDSIEFGFKAVNPRSAHYEVALYKADRIVIERSEGEPTEKGPRDRWLRHSSTSFFVLSLASLAVALGAAAFTDHGSKFTALNEADCALTVVSSYAPFPGQTSPWPWGSGPWQVISRVTNVGSQNCNVQSDVLGKVPVVLHSGEDTVRTTYSVSRPKSRPREFSFGTDALSHTSAVEFYEAQPR